MSAKRSLLKHLLAGETESVFRALTVLADQIGDNRLMNEVMHQYARRQRLERERLAGEIDPGEAERKALQIRQALQLIIETIPSGR